MSPMRDVRRLVRITEAKKRDIDAWREGTGLEQASGSSISDLVLIAATDRWALAYDLRARGNRLIQLRPPLYRDATSRYYYAMYHAMRAMAYVAHGGDDHENHAALPGKVPTDFDDPLKWTTNLKNARLSRNSADYEPYPKGGHTWQQTALNLKASTDELIRLSRLYLRGKGCSL